MAKKAKTRTQTTTKKKSVKKHSFRRKSDKKPGNAGAAGHASQTGSWKSDSEFSKMWKENRNKTDDFSVPDIDDGQYIGKIIGTSIGKTKGITWIRIAFTIMRGDFKGLQPTCWLKSNSEVGVQIMVRTLQRLGFETQELNPDDFPEMVEKIAKDAETCRIKVKNRTGNDGVHYQDTQVMAILDESEQEVATDTNGENDEDIPY